jgi:transcriptional regulator GlxA family with amidase domain
MPIVRPMAMSVLFSEAGMASITAIAAAVGFGDSAYVRRVFQRVGGMRPRADRPRET